MHLLHMIVLETICQKTIRGVITINDLAGQHPWFNMESWTLGSAGVNCHAMISPFPPGLLTASSDPLVPYRLLAVVAMSKVPSTSSTSSNFQSIFYAAMKEYEKKTKKDLLAHPLIGQLQPCNTPDDILAVLRGQVQQFDKSMSGVEKWTKWLNPTVNVLVALSGALGEGVGLVSLIWTTPL